MEGSPRREGRRMTAPTATLRVDRTGKVWRGDRLLGYVDRYDSGGQAHSWRWVNVAGWSSGERFLTRAAAVDALVGAA
jgi:hypothetical protein